MKSHRPQPRHRASLTRSTLAACSIWLSACGLPPAEEAGSEDPAAVAALGQALSGSVNPGDPLPNLTPDQRMLFALGRVDFERDLAPREGLGPVFIERSCVACHRLGGIGGGDALDDANHFVRRFGTLTAGAYDPLAALGGDVQQTRSITGIQPFCSVAPEVVPPQATILALRNPLPIFGDGLIDAVPDAVILAGAVDKGDGVHGRPNLDPTGRPGRFGWKAQANTIVPFTATAAVGTMGLTTPVQPNEPLPQGQPIPAGCTNADVGASSPNDASGAFLFNVVAWEVLLAPVKAQPLNSDARRGRQVFADIGCAKCHTPELSTGAYAMPLRSGATLPVAALSNQSVPLYSDLLLHDMGPELDEKVVMRQAQGPEFRTAPLWGLRLRKRFLHDGRASSVHAAILAHGGESEIIRDRYAGLCDEDRRDLQRFLRAL